MMPSDGLTRRALAAHMRALADFLEARPDLPLSPHTRVEVVYFPRGNDQEQAEEIDRIAALLGTEGHWEGKHYTCEHSFGRAAYRAVAIPAHVRARHRALMSYADAIRLD
ncbi:hypothetical protein ACFPZ0_11335 [Streptomonospora nanhaiensis]|uniref:hypothetical protein n=1 Tax=Streptomonospora nanhaiensis TaxID=1323731 RepID=UPI001C38B367|nr:hypothetical protein [Streptomonospora nanhaiensis]MBV2366004.1 hypothetical protein [Streptomonospora nanhaiensis]MBX9388815.1 hypothetical protein [Streptomonospora nanhaiensis]